MTDDETFCIYCQKEYASPPNLDRHVLRIHPGTYRAHHAEIALRGGKRETMAYQKVTPVGNSNEVIDIAESKGQITEGVYLGSRDIPFGTKEDGTTPDIRVIVDMQGPLGPEDVYSFWASTAIKMTLPQIPKGSRIRLTYRGKETNPKTNRKFKAFDIEVDDGVDEAVAERVRGSAGSGVRV